MYEQEILDYVVSRTPEEVVFKFDRGIKVEAYADGSVVRSKLIEGSINLYLDQPFHTDGHVHTCVHFWIGNKEVHMPKQRFIATTFLGAPADNNMLVRCIDGNRRNHSIDNLEWVTNTQIVRINLLLKRFKEYGINIKRNISVKDYIEFETLGLKFIGKMPKDELLHNLKKIACFINGDVFNIEAVKEQDSDIPIAIAAKIFEK